MAPDAKSCNVNLVYNQKITFACPGPKNSIMYQSTNGMINLNLEVVDAFCDGGSNFKSTVATLPHFSLKVISCRIQPVVSIKGTTKCGKNNDGQNHEVGYTVGNTFYELYKVCFNHYRLSTYYVKHYLHPHSCVTQQSNNSPCFQANGMFRDVAICKLYTSSEQKKRFEKIFGKQQGDVYTSSAVLHKGHLASRADFTMAAELRATYQYINAAPQWDKVNAPRWSNLERALRVYVNKVAKSTVTVYTGTYKVLRLRDGRGSNKDVFLSANNVVPVPMYFYKVVVEAGRPTVAYVTINSAFYSPSDIQTLRFCTDLCDGTHWLTWKDKGTESFCCDYDDFKKEVGYLPI